MKNRLHVKTGFSALTTCFSYHFTAFACQHSLCGHINSPFPFVRTHSRLAERRAAHTECRAPHTERRAVLTGAHAVLSESRALYAERRAPHTECHAAHAECRAALTEARAAHAEARAAHKIGAYFYPYFDCIHISNNYPDVKQFKLIQKNE